MNTPKNAMTQELARPVQELTDAQAEAVEGGITCRKAGGTQQEYMKVTMEDVLISSYQTGG
jgi:type VI protein secretion system component Hcp